METRSFERVFLFWSERTVNYQPTLFPFSALRGAAPTGAGRESMASLATLFEFLVNFPH